jgi:2-polyprenyl-6-methoxyphenol hydroxylase-like FAD-dependent oxidoreductase
MFADVLVVGGGPAGLGAAIAASMRGLRAAVVDPRRPPIDKPCGEGLLPEAVDGLHGLGVPLNSEIAFPLRGICFQDDFSNVSALLPEGRAFGLRRTALHELLTARAAAVGVKFFWGARVSDFEVSGARVDGEFVRCRWLVGADGHNSVVRKWAALEPRGTNGRRFAFREHFSISPWTEFVEVHWTNHAQMILTPVGPREVCAGVFTSDPQMRLEEALEEFPVVAQRLRNAPRMSAEKGTVTALERPRRVTRGSVALIGDASCTVDGVAGQGLSLAFQQAGQLADAMTSSDLAAYESAHRKISVLAMRMTRLLLLMNRSSTLRRGILKIFARRPGLFSKIISIHATCASRPSLTGTEILDLGRLFLRAGG